MDTLYKNIHQEIIDQCKEGSQKAQFQLYKLYYKAMYNSSYRILNNELEAEDVMQESFLDAFRKIEQYDESATFGAWLKRIVINKSIDTLKKKKDTTHLDEIDLPEAIEHFEEDYQESITFKIDEVKKCIDQLSPAYRLVINLYLLEGFDHEEISQITGMSYNACRTKYSRAKQKLLSLLKQMKLSRSLNLN